MNERAGAAAVVVAAVAGALGDQTAAIASEKTVATPRIASTTKPLATSALVLSAVILCWPSGWSAIRGRVYRQSHRRGDNMRLSTSASPGRPHALAVVVAAALAAAMLPASAQAAAPKYFFQLREVKGGPDIDPGPQGVRRRGAEGRPGGAAGVGVRRQAPSPEALLAELNKRKLRGFNVTVRFEQVKKEVKPPKPGSRFNHWRSTCA